MLTQFINILDVTVLPPHVPSLEEQQHPEVFASTIRAQYAAASGYSMAEQGQREFVALSKVSKGPRSKPWKKDTQKHVDSSPASLRRISCHRAVIGLF